MIRTFALAAAAATLALPALAQSLPPGVVGTWDVSAASCAAPGTSVSRIEVAPGRIDTFGGNALVREVNRTGSVTYAAADFEQTEGAAEIEPRTREHFRLTQREGPDRMRFVWKGVQEVNLVRCGASAAPASPRPTEAAAPSPARSLPSGVVGSWDVSLASCAAPGTSVSRIDIAPERIDTFGGNALVREVTRIGTATFAAADFEQLEGAAEIAPRTREYFRLSQREGPDRMRFVWKDVQTVDLVRCEVQIAAAPAPAPSEPVASDAPTFDGQLPIPLGLWVVAGESCESPANAGWRVYDGAGLRGASSSRCEIDAVQRQADGSVLFSQLCRASYDGSVSAVRDRITITASRRFTLVEDGEGAGQDFNWCGSRLTP